MSEVVSQIVALGPDAWHALCVLRLLADEHGVIRRDKSDIASLMKVTVQTLNKRLSALKEFAAVDSVGFIHVSVAPEAPERYFTPILDRLDSSSLIDSSKTGVKIDADAVIRRFIERYQAKYHEKPRIDWRVARNAATAFVRRHGDKSLAIVDAAFENYDVTWRKPAYPRPSFGALMTWLGEVASAYVETPTRGTGSIDVKDMI